MSVLNEVYFAKITESEIWEHAKLTPGYMLEEQFLSGQRQTLSQLNREPARRVLGEAYAMTQSVGNLAQYLLYTAESQLSIYGEIGSGPENIYPVLVAGMLHRIEAIGVSRRRFGLPARLVPSVLHAEELGFGDPHTLALIKHCSDVETLWPLAAQPSTKLKIRRLYDQMGHSKLNVADLLILVYAMRFASLPPGLHGGESFGRQSWFEDSCRNLRILPDGLPSILHVTTSLSNPKRN